MADTNPPIHEDLKALGAGQTKYEYGSADAMLLEIFGNPMEVMDQPEQALIKIVAPEFTSLCPKTGQPDFATIVVEYQPNMFCLESKSWKLYLGSFRQARMFHEDCINQMYQDLMQKLNPMALRVTGQFTPRGGISFWPTMTYGEWK